MDKLEVEAYTSPIDGSEWFVIKVDGRQRDSMKRTGNKAQDAVKMKEVVRKAFGCQD